MNPGFSERSEGVLEIRYKARPGLGLAIMAAALVAGALGEAWLAFFIGGIGICFLWSERRSHCTFDRTKQRFSFSRGGWFDGPFGEESVEGSFDDLAAINLVRLPGRGADQFLLRAGLRSGRSFDICQGSLGFRQCHEYGERLKDFFRGAIPIKAVD